MGARAANLLSLATKSPRSWCISPTAPPRRVKIGAQTIQLKPARPSRFPVQARRQGWLSRRSARSDPLLTKTLWFESCSTP